MMFGYTNNYKKYNLKKRIVTAVLTTAMLITALTGCGLTGTGSSGSAADTGNEPETQQGYYFDTVISITLYGTSTENESRFKDCFDLAEKYENLLSNTIPGSEISKINKNAGSPVEVSDETIEVINTALKYCKQSDGLFDITIGKLSDLWDFDHNTGDVPDEADIQSALDTVNYKNVKVDGNEVTLTDPDSKLDLGGIAKGFIADKMKELLEKDGAESAIINLGGNVLTVGSRPDGKDYTIGIQKPFADDGTALFTVDVSGKSVVTSGTYQRYFKAGDKIYHHILDTSTGYPVDNGLTSVTIISDKSVDGDALSTTAFCMGREKGMDFIESLDGVEAIFVDSDDNIYQTSGIGKDIPFSRVDE